MRNDVKFTVIIPTRERPDTLVHCLRTLVVQNYKNVEFLISDNFSDDNTKEVVESFNDSRIRYINTGKRISMSHNWEFALGHVADGWVTILGDDDGLLPGALTKISELIDITDAKVIMSPWCHYNWPNTGESSSKMMLPLGKGWQIRKSTHWLGKLMSGQADYHELPMLYTGGFVDCRLIAKARSEDGIFFHSCSPDVYSAIALACLTDCYVYLREPVSIAGVSAHSNGASCLGISSNVKPKLKFFSENNIPFHSLLGEVNTISLVVYESYLQSYFLHNNTLGISLAKQLVQALAMANQHQYDELLEYCSTVCKKNNLDINEIERDAKKYRSIRTLLKIKKAPKLLFPSNLRLDASILGVENVYDASWVAKSLYFCLVKNRWWRLHKFVEDIRRVILNSGSMFSRKKSL